MRLQKQRFLKPLKKIKRKSLKIAVFDIETHKWTQLKAIGFYDGKNDPVYFTNFSDFLNHIFSKKYRNYAFYAHNGGRFDFLPLIDNLKDMELKYTMARISSRIAQITVRKGHDTFKFKDSICLLPGRLKDLAESFEVLNLKLDFDFDKNVFDLNNPEHRKYLEHDLKSLYQILVKYFNTEKIRDVQVKLTVASTALSIHRTTLKRQVLTTSDKIQRYVGQSYYGGRTEIFKVEGNNLNVYDFNSVYPYCMLSKPIPVEYIGASHSLEDFGFHYVELFIPETYIPVLPVRYDGKLVFPTGYIKGIYFSEEIKCALMNGAKIIKYHGGKKFTAETDFFSEYVNFFYKMRKEYSGTALDYIAKLYMNGLYGKFGESDEKTIITNSPQCNDYSIFGSRENFEKYGLYLEKIHKRSAHMLKHIASAVCSYGRIHLFENILKTDETISYIDTDSGFTNKNYNVGKELGQLKLERKVDYAYFRLPKTYLYSINGEQKIKAKGFPSEYLKGVTLDDFKNGTLSSSTERVMTFTSAVKRRNESFTLAELKKSLKSKYDKRVILDNGIDTRPLFLTKEGNAI